MKDSEQYSTSLPSSMRDNSQPRMTLNENRLPDQQTSAAGYGNNSQKHRPLMPTEPLMSLNVNLETTDISNPNIFNDYPSIINTNPKYDQMQLPPPQQQQQGDSSNKMSEQMHRQEIEFEKNYVFRMKKVSSHAIQKDQYTLIN